MMDLFKQKSPTRQLSSYKRLAHTAKDICGHIFTHPAQSYLKRSKHFLYGDQRVSVVVILLLDWPSAAVALIFILNVPAPPTRLGKCRDIIFDVQTVAID